MKRWWISWYADGDAPFEWHGPWWIRDHRPLDRAPVHTIVAAVVAEDAQKAKALIVDAHDRPVALDWRFCSERSDDWEPFCESFPRVVWMEWPWPGPKVNTPLGGTETMAP